LLGLAEPILTQEGEPVAAYREAFIGIAVAKLRNAVAVADAGRDGEIRYPGEFDASPESMRRLLVNLLVKMASRHDRLHLCYEAGPTGYGLDRQITALGMNRHGIRTPFLG
jgi:hypothetical protein